MLYSRIIISINVITINAKGSRSPHPNSPLAPTHETSLLTKGESVLSNGLLSQCSFLTKMFLIAEFRILIQ